MWEMFNAVTCQTLNGSATVSEAKRGGCDGIQRIIFDTYR